jgi:hypothetical protein
MSTITFRTMRIKPLWLVLAALALAAILAVAGPAQPAAASCGGVTTVNNETEFDNAIAAFNAVAAGSCVFTIQLGADIPVTSMKTLSNTTPDVSLVIEGAGHAVDGQGTGNRRVFFIFYDTYVTMNEITVKGGNLNNDSGAGILLYNGSTTGGHLTLTNSTVTGNTLTGTTNVTGAGIVVEPYATLTVRNSTISGNSSAQLAGGISNRGSVTLDSVTITNNSATVGGSGYSGFQGQLTIRNTIIAGNTGAPDCRDIAGSVTDQGHNLVQSQNNCGFVNGANGNIVGQAADLGPLANNGGATQTHLPQPGSPAIDAGDTTQAFDQRGIARPFGAADDIGAVEVDYFTLTIVKKAEGGDATFDFGQEAGVSPIPNFSLTTQGGTAQRTFSNLAAGEYKIYEGPRPEGWTLKDITCVGVTGDLWSGAFPYAAFTASPGDNITCTFTNVKGAFTLTIVKKAEGGDATFDFGQEAGVSPIPNFSLATQGGTAQRTFSNLAAGEYKIYEGPRPEGWTLKDITCVGVTGDLWSGAFPYAAFTASPGDNITCTFTNRLSLDFGDAPDTYGTTLAANGARHVVGGALMLGATIDAEADGLPSASADGDDLNDTDDENGVLRIGGKAGTGGWTDGTVASGNGGAVSVNITGAAACLGAFVDFNRDGDFTDAGEAVQLYDAAGVAIAQPIAPAAFPAYFDVPVGTFAGAADQLYGRFRVTSPVSGSCANSYILSPHGLAPDGEVEDYVWSFGPNAVQVTTFSAQPAGLAEWLAQLWRMLTGR